MSTFEQSKSLFTQTHFTLIEIDLPVVEGVCTIGGEPGFGTPLSCDQPSNATRTYKFAEINAPISPELNGYIRLIRNISETPAKLNTGRGLASRGTASISLVDITGKDPNPDAPAVDSTVTSQGAYFQKLVARNVLTNKEIRIKNYRLESDGTIDLVGGAETRYYIIESVSPKKNGEWSIKCKDELSRINIGETVWPIPQDGYLTGNVNDGIQVDIDVDPNINYQVNDTIRVGDELMKINAVSDIGTGTASVTVNTRGNPIVYTNELSETVKTTHDNGDEVFLCEVSDDERIDDLLERILIDVGVDASYIPKSEWAAEIDEWHPLTRVNTLWIESIDTVDVIEKILSNFLIDMWFDPVAREIKISAISVWKESTALLSEGNEIDYDTISRNPEESLRFTRALAIYDKRNLTDPEEVSSYKKASLFKRTELESSDLFGEPKTKRFDFSTILDTDSADLLVNRWVNRYIDPVSYSWTTQERKLSFKTGDVVDLNTSTSVGFDGLPATSTRCQITSIRPSYKNYGREYMITALSYEPIFADNSEIIITGQTSNINLYTQYAGAPSQAVTLTFVFDGTITSSTSPVIPSVRAGAFPAGSKLIIILANGADLQAKGGSGGNGGSLFIKPSTPDVFAAGPPTDGENGGIVFDAEGVDIDIYFSGATPSASYPTADGYIRAPSGGAGGFDAAINDGSSGAGGDGGDGRSSGLGGEPGSATGAAFEGEYGSNGSPDGTGSGWGVDGANNNAVGGTKGKGVVDNGGTVVFFGDTPTRYINGGGSHP